MRLIKDDKLDVKLQPLSETETEKLWYAISEKMTAQPKHQTFFESLLIHRYAYTSLAVVLLLLAGGVGTTALAAQAQPGDILYGVGRAYESLQLSLTSNPEKKAQLSLTFSQKRLQEVDKVLKESKSQTLSPPPKTPNNNNQATTSEELLITITDQKPLKRVEKNHQALIGALNYLENTKAELKKSKNQEKKVEEIDLLVNQLSEQTKDYLKNLERAKQKIPEKNKEVKGRIDHLEKELKEKFRLESRQKQNNQPEEKDEEDPNNEPENNRPGDRRINNSSSTPEESNN